MLRKISNDQDLVLHIVEDESAGAGTRLMLQWYVHSNRLSGLF